MKLTNDTQAFSKYRMVEITEEDYDLWEWFLQNKSKWKRIRKEAPQRVILNFSRLGKMKMAITFVED